MSEKTKFIIILCTATITGIILEQILVIIIIALIAYTIWLINSINNVKNWFNIIHTNTTIPDISADFNDIFSNIIKLEKSVQLEKKQHKKTIIRFNEILRSFPYPTIITNADNEIVWVSKNAAKMLGLSRKKDIGIKIGNLIRDTHFQESLTNAEKNEAQIISPLDENITLMIAISKINRNIRILSIRDISTRIKLEETRKNFIANASHELRTPLTVISGYIQILNTQKDLNSSQQEIVDNAYKYCIKMESLITDLLSLANLESSNAQKMIDVNMSDIIYEVQSNLYDTDKYKNRIKTNIDNELLVRGIKSQIQSMVFNLVENALKYSRDIVEIQWKTTHNKAVLQVIDNGFGISDSDKHKILYPFYRIQHTSDIDGTGLGLSIVDQAVINNNATLKILDNIDAGTIFQISFDNFTKQ